MRTPNPCESNSYPLNTYLTVKDVTLLTPVLVRHAAKNNACQIRRPGYDNVITFVSTDGHSVRIYSDLHDSISAEQLSQYKN